MLKVKVRWQGFTGSPGWSNFFYDDNNGGFESLADAQACSDRVKNFFTAVQAEFPTHVAWAIQSDVEVIDPATGKLTNVMTTPAPAVINGTAPAANYSAASGAVITWRTAGVRNGRRVRGRTFLVPIATVALQADGSIRDNLVTGLNNLATTMANIPGPLSLGVWARPSAQGASDGEFHKVTGVSIPDKVAILRSRRD